MEEKILILVVDDEPDVVEFLSYNLLKNNFDVMKAYSGSEAIEKAIARKPDVIIMDIRMPKMNGIETCRQLRTMEGLKDVPILFLTADSDEYITMSAFEAGANHFITKPVKPSIIAGMISEILQHRI